MCHSGLCLENQDNTSDWLTALAPSRLFDDKYAYLHYDAKEKQEEGIQTIFSLFLQI